MLVQALSLLREAGHCEEYIARCIFKAGLKVRGGVDAACEATRCIFLHYRKRGRQLGEFLIRPLFRLSAKIRNCRSTLRFSFLILTCTKGGRGTLHVVSLSCENRSKVTKHINMPA